MDRKPEVSIIVPCYNEERTIAGLLQALDEQTFPSSHMEVIIADGLSTDRTRQVIQETSRRFSELFIRIVDNPERNIPSALNQAIQAAQGEFIIRLDAHSKPEQNYIQRCLEVLDESGAANVGGVWLIEPRDNSWTARSIAAAAAHPLGAGDARYRIGGQPGEVDTVPFGAYRRSWIEKVGPYNKALLTNEDYEYNYRIRQLGGKVWFDPSIRAVYYARRTFGDLARQYSRYGYWKARMLLENPESLRWRQALPPLFVLSAVILSLLSPFSLAAWSLLAVQLGAYALATTAFGVVAALRTGHIAIAAGFPLALAIMHFCWGGSFLWSLLTRLIGRRHERTSN
jgi:glycosyltransferase involved in cell wall biosynthesis